VLGKKTAIGHDEENPTSVFARAPAPKLAGGCASRSRPSRESGGGALSRLGPGRVISSAQQESGGDAVSASGLRTVIAQHRSSWDTVAVRALLGVLAWRALSCGTGERVAQIDSAGRGTVRIMTCDSSAEKRPTGSGPHPFSSPAGPITDRRGMPRGTHRQARRRMTVPAGTCWRYGTPEVRAARRLLCVVAPRSRTDAAIGRDGAGAKLGVPSSTRRWSASSTLAHQIPPTLGTDDGPTGAPPRASAEDDEC